MSLGIRQIGADGLKQYSEISIGFTVESVLRVEEIDGGLGGLLLQEERLEEPYEKDYDVLAEEEELPTRWPEHFDVSNWAFFMAFDGERPVGGAVVAYHSPKVNMLEGRSDLAVLWDLRVHPDRRREGIGTRLFQHATEWARRRNCTQFKIETQNTNAGACKFYARQGCYLGGIMRHAYPEPVAHETMLLWYLNL